jgi:transcriptional regulator with XRE-family HTH domain
MKESFESMESHLDDPEFRHAYAESFMNSYVAAQIKTIREQRGLTQAQLAERLGTKQAGISRLENVNYDAWKVETLARIAQALDVRLRISFEEFESLFDEITAFRKENLRRADYAECQKRARPKKSPPAEPSKELKQALAPGFEIDPSKRLEVRGERNEDQIRSLGEGVRLSLLGGADLWQRSTHPEPYNSPEQEVSVSHEPQLTGAA